MNLLRLNILVNIFIIFVIFIRKYGGKRIASYFYSVLWEAIIIKLLLSFFVPIIKMMVASWVLKNESNANEKIKFGIFENLNVWIMCIWIFISICLLCMFVLNYCRFLKRIYKTTSADGFNGLFHISHNKKHIHTKMCTSIQSPLTFGIFKSTILLPQSVLVMTEEEQKYLLYHELVHAKHRDSLWKILAVIIATIYWFNPFVWILVKFFDQDLELRCDYNVVSKLGGKVEYAELLLKFARNSKNPVYLLNGFGDSIVKKRIVSIMNFDKEKKKYTCSLLVSTTFIILLIFFKMDSIESISESIGKSQVVELNELEEREHPLYVYEENGIEYVNGKWFFKGSEIGGLVDVGYCIYVDEGAKSSVWIYVSRNKNGQISSLDVISEKEGWEKVEK